MNQRIPVHLICLAIAVFGAVAATWAQSGDIKIKTTAMTYTRASSGREMYRTYCVSCHGLNAEGNGPAAPAFKKPPTNLTMLAKNHGGKYPWLEVDATLRFGTATPAHGTVQMPVWGDLFHQFDRDTAKIRINGLNYYIQSLQKK